MHAEVWEHEGKMYIKDVKSSNGTFVNGDRLSAEGVESEPFELKSEDMVVRPGVQVHPILADAVGAGVWDRHHQRR